MKRVVLDTNILISALFWKGYPRIIYDLIRNKKVIMLMSVEMEKEFIRVMGYKKFGLTPQEIIPVVRDMRWHSEFVNTTTRIRAIEADPTDNIFLECAVDGKADYIISGDRHLLALGSFRGIPIVRAKDFLVKEGFAEE